jgi:hypothetical protein
MQAMSCAPDGRFIVANAMATALRTAASAERLVASRETVRRWVRQATGSELAERRRRIDAVFAGRASASTDDGWSQTTGRRPGAESRGFVASMMDTHVLERYTPISVPSVRPDTAPSGSRLTGWQRLIIIAASTLTFVATVAIGMALLSGSPAGAKARRSPESASRSESGPVAVSPAGPNNH